MAAASTPFRPPRAQARVTWAPQATARLALRTGGNASPVAVVQELADPEFGDVVQLVQFVPASQLTRARRCLDAELARVDQEEVAPSHTGAGAGAGAGTGAAPFAFARNDGFGGKEDSSDF